MAKPVQRYVVLLRALNVGGTGKLSMADLKRHCVAAGFSDPTTYLATGNVIVESPLTSAAIRKKLESELTSSYSQAVGLFVYTATELGRVLNANPFANCNPSRLIIQFLAGSAAADAATNITGQTDEEIAAGPGVLYVHYPNGQGKTRLRFRQAAHMTGRNLNTVNRLLALVQS